MKFQTADRLIEAERLALSAADALIAFAGCLDAVRLGGDLGPQDAYPLGVPSHNAKCLANACRRLLDGQTTLLAKASETQEVGEDYEYAIR